MTWLPSCTALGAAACGGAGARGRAPRGGMLRQAAQQHQAGVPAPHAAARGQGEVAGGLPFRVLEARQSQPGRHRHQQLAHGPRNWPPERPNGVAASPLALAPAWPGSLPQPSIGVRERAGRSSPAAIPSLFPNPPAAAAIVAAQRHLFPHAPRHPVPPSSVPSAGRAVYFAFAAPSVIRGRPRFLPPSRPRAPGPQSESSPC